MQTHFAVPATLLQILTHRSAPHDARKRPSGRHATCHATPSCAAMVAMFVSSMAVPPVSRLCSALKGAERGAKSRTGTVSLYLLTRLGFGARLKAGVVPPRPPG